ncbi:MAG: hypothetical protein Q9159_000401 [Coniocarpon cinnabarinum]
MYQPDFHHDDSNDCDTIIEDDGEDLQQAQSGELVPRFVDADDTYMLPPKGESVLSDADFICSERQQEQDLQNALFVSAGDSIILKYNENGHITKPWADPTKPNPGKVYIYGTDSPRPDETLSKVHKRWPQDSRKGVNGGSLLGVFDFDDGRCYQYSTDSEIEAKREDLYGHGDQPEEGLNLWCSNLVTLPLVMFKPTHTIYWVWDWPDKLGNPQIYTSCLDLQIA